MNLKTKIEQLKLTLNNIKINTSSLMYKRQIDVPIYLFGHHKAGSTLLTKIFGQICEFYGWRFGYVLEKTEGFSSNDDIILFAHSLIDKSLLEKPFVGIHLIRDPRDIIVSGYLYHLRTKEKWCVNKDFSLNSPIKSPQVPFLKQHCSEEWKRNYLKSLKNCSYQENLLNLSRSDGLIFEMNNFASWTIQQMIDWEYTNPLILEIKFEDLMTDFDNTVTNMIDFCNICKNDSDRNTIFQIAKRHDLSSKSDQQIASMKHITSRKTNRWQDYFEQIHKDLFIEKFGDILIQLGYEKNNSW